MKLRYRIAMIALIVGLVGCDHATKHLARQELRGADDVTLVSGVLDLTYTENRAAAFSVMRSVPEEVRLPFLLGVNLLVVLVLPFVWYYRRRARWSEHLAYAVLLAGGLGNTLDRLLRGYVIDFIHLHYWPIFNVADICLVAGMILLLWRMLRERPPEPAPQ